MYAEQYSCENMERNRQQTEMLSWLKEASENSVMSPKTQAEYIYEKQNIITRMLKNSEISGHTRFLLTKISMRKQEYLNIIMEKFIPQKKSTHPVKISQVVHGVVNENPSRNFLNEALTKVKYVMILLILFTRVGTSLSVNVEVKIDKGVMLIYSNMNNIEIQERTEKINLNRFDNFIVKLENILHKIGSLREFSPHNNNCQIAGNSVDNLDEVINVAKTSNLNYLMIDAKESNKIFHQKEFEIILYKPKMADSKVTCEYGYSLGKIVSMLALSPLNNNHIPWFSHDQYEFFKKQKSIMYDENGNNCGYQGRFKNNQYNKQIILEPIAGLESCSRICRTSSEIYNRMKQLRLSTGANLTSSYNECAAFSYDIQNNFCILTSKFVDEDINNLDQSWSNKNSDYSGFLSFTAKRNCKPYYDSKNRPEIYMGKYLIKVDTLCNFSNKKLKLELKNMRCNNLANKLQFPVRNMLINFKTFLTNFKLAHIKSNKINRERRQLKAISKIGSKFISALSFARKNINQISKLTDYLGTSNLSPNKLLENIKSRMMQNGYKSKITKISGINQIDNLDLNMDLVQSYESFLKIPQEINNVELFLSNLQQEAMKHKNSLQQTILDYYPRENITKDFIGKSKFIYTSYIYENQTIRHFIKAVESNKYKSTFLTLIPLDERFFKRIYFQQSIMKNKNPLISECWISILNDGNVKDIKERCNGNDFSINFDFNNDIVSLEHKFGSSTGKIVVINKKAIIQTFCKSSNLIIKCQGFCVLGISQDCSLFVNSFPRISASGDYGDEKSFSEIYIHRNTSIIKHMSNKLYAIEINILDIIQWTMIGILFVLICIIMAILCKGRYYNTNDYDLQRSNVFNNINEIINV